MARDPFAAKLSSIWIGAIFFWIIKGFRNKLNEQFSKQYEKRNFVAGYIIQVMILIFVMYLFVKLKS
jgi:hypothetical protein